MTIDEQLLLALGMASIALWVVIIARLAQGQAILKREPRYPVPWNGAAALPALLFSSLAVLGSLAPVFLTVEEAAAVEEAADNQGDAGNGDADDEDDANTDGDLGLNVLALNALVMLGMLVIALAVVVGTCGANRHDLGLPHNPEQLFGDIGIGLMTALAALAPVYLVQLVAFWFVGAPQHPLIEQMIERPDPLVFIMVGISAIVVAPLVEEVIYRLLLQGALERWEDDAAGLVSPSLDDGDVDMDSSIELVAASPPAENPFVSPVAAEPVAQQPELVQVELAPAWHGWIAITVSSVLFSLAHLGHGASPIGLTVLAILLGYVYQRTHRIVPTIVAHAAFNAVSVTLVILAIAAGEAPQN